MAKLRGRQEKFCLAYAACGNATEAALKAGYSKKTARTIGSENLTKVDIQKRIAELGKKATQKAFLTIEEKRRILQEIAQDPEARKDERMKAIDLDNKMEGVYINRTELTGAYGGPLEFVWAGDCE